MSAVTTAKMDGQRNPKWRERDDIVTHFFVTCVLTWEDTFEDLPEEQKKWNKQSSRCWGYAPTFEEAEARVLENYTDIHECTDQWVIIEEHIMDVFAMGTGFFQWYHWNEEKEGYERCRQPDWAKQVCHWGIG